MRIAVIAQQASAGGGTRFLRPLLKGLAETYPDVRLTVYLNSFATETFGADANLAGSGIEVVPIDPVLCATPGSPLDGVEQIARTTLVESLGGRFDRRSEGLKAAGDLARAASRADVVYLAWPYFLPPMRIDAPLVGTFHDFNFRHDFGTLGENFRQLLDRQVSYWLGQCDVAVCSAEFIAEEMRSFYGDLVTQQRVVRLSSLLAGMPEEGGPAVAPAFGLPERYVICPSNTSRHKNLDRLLRAYVRVREAGGPPLVLMGNGTSLFHGLSPAQQVDPTALMLAEAFAGTGLRLGEDVYALGYVSDREADALIAEASLLVAPSLYEAGSGPGLDAWAVGTPVVMSAIPPFLEHLTFLGVEATTFDPLSEDDMVRALIATLEDESAAHDAAARSRAAMGRYTWADVARGYRDAFEAAIVGKR